MFVGSKSFVNKPANSNNMYDDISNSPNWSIKRYLADPSILQSEEMFFHPEASSQATNNSQDEILENSENTLLDISQSYLPMLDDADLGLQQSAAAEKEENISPYSMPYAENSEGNNPGRKANCSGYKSERRNRRRGYRKRVG